MSNRKLFAGHALRRLRRGRGLTQAAMAEVLGISASYLNLLERNGRPLTAALLVRLTDRFDFDPRALSAAEPGGGADAIRRRLADPMFADLEIDRTELEEWLAASPGGAEAFARAFDRLGTGGGAAPAEQPDPAAMVRREIERWHNHFADLDAAAETVADELRQGAADLYGAVAERLRVRHQLTIRVLPADVLAGTLRRLDLHARQLQLSEVLDAPGRTFAAAVQLGVIEARAEIDALVRGAGLTDRTADRLYRRHLGNYFAAALVMPYGRFVRACEAGGYDLDLLCRRFGASVEQAAHRLTTLGRVGARGLPFFLLRIDRAGQVSKRLGGGPAEARGRCPLWAIHRAFDRPGRPLAQLVEMEDGGRFLTLSRTVTPQDRYVGGVAAEFALGLGVPADRAAGLSWARGVDLNGEAVPIGPGCRACHRPDCAQRSIAPQGRALLTNERDRQVPPLVFAGD